jgi:predicted nucleotidyltransferase
VSRTASPFREALEALARAGVDFVLVGVSGINFYARDAADIVRTVDLDVMIRRRVEELRAALRALHAAGFSFEAGGEPFVDRDDEAVLARIVESGGNVAAVGGGGRIDLMLSMSGFGFDELATDAERFRIGDIEVAVGRLEKLLRSKELAGRAKDREFLRLFAARLREDAEREP